MSGIANAVGASSYVETMAGNWAAAEPLIEEALALNQQIGQRFRVVDNHFSLGQVRRFMNEPEQAEEHYRAALTMLLESPRDPRISTALRAMGAAALKRGHLVRAIHLAVAGERLQQELASGLPEDLVRIGDTRAAARVQMGGDEFGRAVADGEALTFDEAIAEALGNAEPAS